MAPRHKPKPQLHASLPASVVMIGRYMAQPCRPKITGACSALARYESLPRKTRPAMTVLISTLIKDASAQTLGSLCAILKKGADHAAALKIPEDVLLNYRLFPDMFPLTRQVQITTDTMTRGAARLAGTDLPSFPDVETSFTQLIDRTQKANAYVQAASSEAIDGRCTTIINIPIGGGQEMPMTCTTYLQSFVFPNLYFHAATAYNLLRHNGVPIGKLDFLGKV
jgi:hypothetical protein